MKKPLITLILTVAAFAGGYALSSFEGPANTGRVSPIASYFEKSLHIKEFESAKRSTDRLGGHRGWTSMECSLDEGVRLTSNNAMDSHLYINELQDRLKELAQDAGGTFAPGAGGSYGSAMTSLTARYRIKDRLGFIRVVNIDPTSRDASSVEYSLVFWEIPIDPTAGIDLLTAE